jgi:hypothetical protein
MLIWLLVQFVTATLTNRTIDDQNGDSVTKLLPSYSPVGGWTQGSTCSTCGSQPNPDQAVDGTWHDSTYYPGSESRDITLTFNGKWNFVYITFLGL